jgi:NitT/TauT family transport system ATP-binding protein
LPNIGPSSAERPPLAGAGRPYVEVDAVRKIYNPGAFQIEAVSEVSFAVRPREFVSILGPSGCGKSTLLMMIGGLEPPTAGAVRIGGSEVSGPRAETGVIFQDPTLLPWKTVLENVLFPVRIQQRELARYRSRALELLRMVGLYPFRDKRPHQLSGGMKQRAAICRALVCDPDLLLMDEPFSALDAITRDELNVALLDIWERHHKTGLFVTHSIREAVFLSDRVIVMGLRPSRIVADVAIGFARPRDIHLQESPEFSAIVAMLRDYIGSQHG